MDSEMLKVALAALLHDIGKFWQRTGIREPHNRIGYKFLLEFKHLIPYEWRDDVIDAVEKHHNPKVSKEIEKIVKAADWLASGEREEAAGMERMDPAKTPLLAGACKVKFLYGSPEKNHWFKLHAMEVDEENFFPAEDVSVYEKDYQNLWNKFTDEVGKLNEINNNHTFLSLFYLMKKYLSYMPSATPWEEDEEHRTWPDISLFDHLKVTAAIATCLRRIFPDELVKLLRRDQISNETPICTMVAGDISGIQKFIYSITQPGTRKAGTAKRLRGRSFYLSILCDIIADLFVRKMGLCVANILFNSGGSFTILVGKDKESQEKITEITKDLEKWLLDNFYGELGLQITKLDLFPSDFQDMTKAYEKITDDLNKEKQRKFINSIQHPDFYKIPVKNICPDCGVTPINEEDEICTLCKEQLEIGDHIRESEFLTYLYEDAGNLPLRSKLSIRFDTPFLLTIALQDEHHMKELMRYSTNGAKIILYKLNKTDFLNVGCPKYIGQGFRFLSNEVPVALMGFPSIKTEKDTIKKGDVLDFEEIAWLSRGAKLLGILKIDVDNTGHIFHLGVEPKKTISRLSTLSNTLDAFFMGWLNEVCKQVTKTWKDNLEENDNRKNLVNEIFYILYSGGDDLFIIGPWDQVIELSLRLYDDFRNYTCHNENITLSAGIIFTKPHFPINRFAPLVDGELSKSKIISAEKNSATIFKETVKWKGGAASFEELISFGKTLAELVESKKMPKSFVYYLDELRNQHFKEDGAVDLMWVPKLYYAAARRLTKEVMEEIGGIALPTEKVKKIHIPVAYVSLLTRE